jgi:hypothetical protein
MKKFAYALCAGIMLVACNQTGENQNQEQTVKDIKQMQEHGKYLVNMMGCNDCHTGKIMTPNGPMPDTNMLLAGHPAGMPLPPFDTSTANSWVLFHMNGTAIKGPWGISYAANLTPDTTGIGFWTEAQFFRAMKHGDAKGIEGNRKLLPPMPWQNYANASDEDLRDIFAYLKSIKPVQNVVPQPQPPVAF